MKSKSYPDLSSRPFSLVWEGFLSHPPETVYEAWTTGFDKWFAQPGETFMHPEVDRPFFFYNKLDWGRHPHYGRFLELQENRLVEMTWLTGDGTQGGTEGAETVIRLELSPKDQGTAVRFTHSGFVNERSRDGHDENWPLAFEELERSFQE